MLVEAIATQEIPKPKAKQEPVAVVVSKKKRSIRAGISFEDIFHHYTVEDLDAWCREHGVKTSGPKKKIILRILDYLAGDTESTLAKPKLSDEEKAARKEEKEKLAQERLEKKNEKARLRKLRDENKENESESNGNKKSKEVDPSLESLDGMVFWLTGTFTDAKKHLITKVLRKYGASVYQKLTDGVTHVIAADPLKKTKAVTQVQEKGLVMLGPAFIQPYLDSEK